MKEHIKLGDVVKVFDWTENKEGILAYVYLIKEDPGEQEYTVYLLDCHGVNLGPYNPVMREFFIDRIGSSGFEYQFTTFLQVTEDVQNGVFDKLWKQYVPIDQESPALSEMSGNHFENGDREVIIAGFQPKFSHPSANS